MLNGTIADHDHPFGERSHQRIMRYHDDRHALFIIQLLHDLHQLKRIAAVQGACRLICHDDIGIMDQSTAYGRALTLAGRALIRIFIQDVCDPEAFSQFLQAIRDLSAVCFQHCRRQSDVFIDRFRIQKVEFLKDKSEMFPAEPGDFIAVHLTDIFSHQRYGPAGIKVQCRQHIDECAFARP